MHQIKLVFLLLISTIPFLAFSTDKPLQNTTIDFYSTTLELQYDLSMLKKNKHCTSTICLKKFYKRLEATQYQVLLDDLLKHKEQLNLNDWLFYGLVRKAIEDIYKKESDMFKTSATWFIMTKAGYDTRLYTAKSKYTFLYVRTEEKVFEAPFIKIKGKPYINLTSLYYGFYTKGILFEVSKFQPGQLNNKPFSFVIDKLPALPPQNMEKVFKFKFDKEEIVLNVKVDTLCKQILRNFPITKPINYIKAPMSKSTMASLKTALQPHLEGKSINDQIRVLVSFTRKAFPYKNDQIRYQQDRPLTADQLMLADSSDFEDRCALFYNLLKETTDLQFVIVQYMYDDIITFGIELPTVTGAPFVHEDINYTICDPTMPSNSSKLGLYPISLDKDIEILEVVRHGENLIMKE